MTLNEDQVDNGDEEDDEIPHFSLVTGKLVYSEQSRPMRTIAPKQTIEYDSSNGNTALVKSETQVAIKEDGTVAVCGVRSLAGEKLRGRSWQGLDSSIEGATEGAEVQSGLSGVARGYQVGDHKA